MDDRFFYILVPKEDMLECKLPLKPGNGNDTIVSGTQFGISPNSRQEFIGYGKNFRVE